LRLNEKVLKEGFRIEKSNSMLFFGIRVPSNVWQGQMKKIEPKAYPLLYSVDQIVENKTVENSGIGVGAYLDVQLKFKYGGRKVLVKRAFAWGGGE
jgi:hypothetical protein